MPIADPGSHPQGTQLRSGTPRDPGRFEGPYSAVTKALKGYVCVQRCQWHKRENILSYLPERDWPRIKGKLQKAYDLETDEQAKAALKALKRELAVMNQSAATSLEEGLEETLTLHRLGLMRLLKRSFRTMNCIENVNSQTADRTRKVKRWTNSPQRQRWLAAALLDIEPRLRRVHGYRHLEILRQALKRDLRLESIQDELRA